MSANGTDGHPPSAVDSGTLARIITTCDDLQIILNARQNGHHSTPVLTVTAQQMPRFEHTNRGEYRDTHTQKTARDATIIVIFSF